VTAVPAGPVTLQLSVKGAGILSVDEGVVQRALNELITGGTFGGTTVIQADF
jgi:hypothetical protein